MKQGILLLFSPLNEARRSQVERVCSLHPDVALLSELPAADELPDWASGLFKVVLTGDRNDLPDFLTKIRSYSDRSGLPVIGVISLTETGVYFCSRLAQALDLRFSSPEMVVRARDKSLMRDIFSAHGLPTVPYGTACCVEEGLHVARRIGYPIVIKPLLAGGSVFIRRVESDRELSEVFDCYMQGGIQKVANDPLVRMTVGADANPRILIEKLIGGKTKFETTLPLPVGEVSIEGCVLDGKTHVLGFHDKPLPANGPHYEEVLWSTPTRLSLGWQKELRDVARRTIASIGLEHGIFHLETRTTDEGPVILEVAARMGGGPIYRSIRESSGIDMIEIMYRIATRQEVSDELLQPAGSIPVMTFGFFAPEGELLNIRGIEEVRAHPNVVEAAIYEYPGTYIHRAPRSDHCTVHVMVRADSHSQAEDIGRWAEETIKFESHAG